MLFDYIRIMYELPSSKMCTQLEIKIASELPKLNNKQVLQGFVNNGDSQHNLFYVLSY